MFQLPRLPILMAIGKHSFSLQCSDTSRNPYSPKLIFNALTQGKYLLETYPNVLGFMNYVTSDYLTHKSCYSGTNLYILVA